ncbi:hypothetical protein TNCV_3756761 [Trichonephila clavipes]|nr:hypothetical protein TNCV_3756761 [Trichonephila clavipes]
MSKYRVNDITDEPRIKIFTLTISSERCRSRTCKRHPITTIRVRLVRKKNLHILHLHCMLGDAIRRYFAGKRHWAPTPIYTHRRKNSVTGRTYPRFISSSPLVRIQGSGVAWAFAAWGRPEVCRLSILNISQKNL